MPINNVHLLKLRTPISDGTNTTECAIIAVKDNTPELVTVQDDGSEPYKPSQRTVRRRHFRKSRLSLKKSLGIF